MKLRLRHLLALVLAAPVAAVAVAWLGIFGVGAASGHWAITDWFLHFAMRSSVRTAALGVDAPELPREALRPAAGHFARGCAPCHGAPDAPRPPSALAMLPTPPDLVSRVGTWTDAELQRIVMRGVRFTGMPAWPAPVRDDEGWMMVAFLRTLPGLDAAGYRALVDGREGTLPGACSGCHGPEGRDGGPLVPRLAGQSAAYLDASLAAYAGGTRASGVMQQAVAGLRPGIRAELVRALAALPRETPAAAPAGGGPKGTVTPSEGTPACLSCHDGRRNPGFPILDGQPAPYLAAQLRLFHDGTRGGGPYAGLMTAAARDLEDAEIDALAEWFASR